MENNKKNIKSGKTVQSSESKVLRVVSNNEINIKNEEEF